MSSYLKTIFLGRREGKIVLFVSLFYLLIGTLAKAFPSLNPLSKFFTWMCFYMPIVMLIFFAKLRCYRRSYESRAFNTIVLSIVSLTPALMDISVYLNH